MLTVFCEGIHLKNVSSKHLFINMSSVESQKGVIAVQRCSAENQKGRYRRTKSMTIVAVSGSQRNIFELQ